MPVLEGSGGRAACVCVCVCMCIQEYSETKEEVGGDRIQPRAELSQRFRAARDAESPLCWVSGSQCWEPDSS